ncbi:MAG: hypothetical protein J0H02_06265, partial [Armatimonadetes bacterium]|nr:hypothetical protein [Armatimonadota bacterium]
LAAEDAVRHLLWIRFCYALSILSIRQTYDGDDIGSASVRFRSENSFYVFFERVRLLLDNLINLEGDNGSRAICCDEVILIVGKRQTLPAHITGSFRRFSILVQSESCDKVMARSEGFVDSDGLKKLHGLASEICRLVEPLP